MNKSEQAKKGRSIEMYNCSYLTMTWPANNITAGTKVWLMFGNSVPRFAEDTHFCYSYDTWYRELRAERCLTKNFQKTRVHAMTHGLLSVVA